MLQSRRVVNIKTDKILLHVTGEPTWNWMKNVETQDVLRLCHNLFALQITETENAVTLDARCNTTLGKVKSWGLGYCAGEILTKTKAACVKSPHPWTPNVQWWKRKRGEKSTDCWTQSNINRFQTCLFTSDQPSHPNHYIAELLLLAF